MTTGIDVIDLLERDHRMIDDLAEQLDAATDPVEIRRLYLRIVDELSVHEAVEQQVVFPAFKASFDETGDATLDHRLDEHEELNELLAEMRGLDPTGFAFVKRGSALLLEMKGHFGLEEESVFARMRAVLAPEELVELGNQAMEVKQRWGVFPGLPTERPHNAER